jgi:hypothetical protein
MAEGEGKGQSSKVKAQRKSTFRDQGLGDRIIDLFCFTKYNCKANFRLEEYNDIVNCIIKRSDNTPGPN